MDGFPCPQYLITSAKHFIYTNSCVLAIKHKSLSLIILQFPSGLKSYKSQNEQLSLRVFDLQGTVRYSLLTKAFCSGLVWSCLLCYLHFYISARNLPPIKEHLEEGNRPSPSSPSYSARGDSTLIAGTGPHLQ